MKIAVIGNSHVAALKNGFDQNSQSQRGVDLTFFAARGDLLKGILNQNNVLIAEDELLEKSIYFTSGGHDRIDPSRFDIFLLYGMGARSMMVDNKKFYSHSAMQKCADDIVYGTLSSYILTVLSSATKKPIYIGHNPLRASEVSSYSQSLDRYHAGIISLNHFIYKNINSTIIPQPDETIVNGNGTAMKFSIGSTSLEVGDENDRRLHEIKDVHHMNAEFGGLWMNNFINIIK